MPRRVAKARVRLSGEAAICRIEPLPQRSSSAKPAALFALIAGAAPERARVGVTTGVRVGSGVEKGTGDRTASEGWGMAGKVGVGR